MMDEVKTVISIVLSIINKHYDYYIFGNGPFDLSDTEKEAIMDIISDITCDIESLLDNKG